MRFGAGEPESRSKKTSLSSGVFCEVFVPPFWGFERVPVHRELRSKRLARHLNCLRSFLYGETIETKREP